MIMGALHKKTPFSGDLSNNCGDIQDDISMVRYRFGPCTHNAASHYVISGLLMSGAESGA
jgi:hypothetical protein